MHLRDMSKINLDRCQEWHTSINDWSVNDWAVAAGGEMGEALNMCKKLRRMTSDIDSPNNPASVDICIESIGKEIADTFWYLDLLAQRLGLDLETIARQKFDEISAREGLPQRMIPGWRLTGSPDGDEDYGRSEQDNDDHAMDHLKKEDWWDKHADDCGARLYGCESNCDCGVDPKATALHPR